MKKGKLLLNWQKEPVGVHLGDNKVFCLKKQKTYSYSNQQMLALFCQENGLQGANLSYAHLLCANLTGANLKGANLEGTNLTGADLYRANLSCANLTGGYLDPANLRYANLRCADLRGADLRGVGHNSDTRWPEGFNKSRLSS